MKSLLIKDLKLMNMQKNFFLIIIVVSIFVCVVTSNAVTPITFLTFIGSMFTLSTISYDEFDNGNAFLFTLDLCQ
ncbi:ABC-2 transporter permease [Enterococcus sp. AZ196]|uniref:ABC-2 transporter permease n=1 Tax=Enterococcus sp. AZ196 TaxID=2774659 RepID=UPI003D2D6ACF